MVWGAFWGGLGASWGGPPLTTSWGDFGQHYFGPTPPADLTATLKGPHGPTHNQKSLFFVLRPFWESSKPHLGSQIMAT